MFNDDIPDSLIKANNERILSSVGLIMQNRIEDVSSKENISEKNDEITLSRDEIAFLWDIYNRPFVSITERYKTFNLGG